MAAAATAATPSRSGPDRCPPGKAAPKTATSTTPSLSRATTCAGLPSPMARKQQSHGAPVANPESTRKTADRDQGRGPDLAQGQRDPGQHHQDHGGADEGGEIRVRGLDADLGREPPSAWRRRRQQRPELPKRKNGSHGAAPRTGRAGSSVRAAFRPPAGRRPRRGGGVPVARALVLSRDGAQGPHPGRPCPADRRRGVPPVQPSCAVVAAGAAAWARARAARRRSSGCGASAKASATAA